MVLVSFTVAFFVLFDPAEETELNVEYKDWTVIVAVYNLMLGGVSCYAARSDHCRLRGSDLILTGRPCFL